MKSFFFRKNTFYFLIFILLNLILSNCKFGEIKSPSQCKTSAINYSLLKYNTSNQIEGTEITNTLTTKYKYDNYGNIIRQSIFNSNILTSYIAYTWDYTNNIVQISKFEKSQNSFQESQRDSFFLDTQKRIIKIKKSDSSYKRFEYQNDNVTRVFYYSGTHPEYLYLKFNAFDNTLNPYYGTPLKMFMLEDTGDGFHFSKNNAVQCSYYNPDGSVKYISLLAHAYDDNGNAIKLESPTGQNWYFSYVCN